MKAVRGPKLRVMQPTVQFAELGTTEHAVLVLVLVELAALVMVRRVFKTAHGG